MESQRKRSSHMWMFLHVLCWVLWLCSYCVADQCPDASTKGKTFLFGATHGRDDYYDQETDTLHISSEISGQVTVQTLNYSTTYNISEGLTTIDIPKYLRHDHDGKYKKGIVITTDTDATAYVFQNYPLYDSTGITLLPLEALSTSYILASYEPFSIYYKSYFVVVAFMDKTFVEITLKTLNHTRPAVMNTVLNKFETFYIQRHHDISGTIVTSSHPIAVFSGSDCVDIPFGIPYGNCDRVDTQVIPSIYYGTDYIVPGMYPRLAYMVRIISVFSETDIVLTNETDSWTLSLSKSGEVNDVYMGTEPVVIQSNHKVAVYQYAVSHAYDNTPGSEFMAAVSPVNQYSSNYVFPTQLKPNYYTWTYRNFASVIIETSKMDGLLVNGTSLEPVQNQSVPVPYGNYSVVTFELAGTSQNISHENGDTVKFGLIAYGQNDATGYGYTGGREFRVSEPINVALGKPTSQSTQQAHSDSSRAVDGNRDQSYGRGSCTHTLRTTPGSWWLVDLLDVYNISSIIIYNRMDCCSCPVWKVETSAPSTQSSTSTSTPQYTNNTLPSTKHTTESSMKSTTIYSTKSTSTSTTKPLISKTVETSTKLMASKTTIPATKPTVTKYTGDPGIVG